MLVFYCEILLEVECDVDDVVLDVERYFVVFVGCVVKEVCVFCYVDGFLVRKFGDGFVVDKSKFFWEFVDELFCCGYLFVIFIFREEGIDIVIEQVYEVDVIVIDGDSDGILVVIEFLCLF